ncbi:MAG: flap endonuclease-1 [Thermoplasmata archaeon]
MGVDISDIIESKEIDMGNLKNQSIAIDGYNTLYQFLSIIRQPDGTPLMDDKGRITSHLSGIFYRTVNMMESGIKPIYVFDGKPPELKQRTISQRIEKRRASEEEWKKALEMGDVEKARLYAQGSSRLTKDMVDDSKKLLELMGVPWVQAPSEGEAQAAYMAMKGDVYASASQDFDSLLFGAPRLVRNLTITGKRKIPRKNIYREIKPELIVLDEILKNLGINREQLVDIGILIGTDFNEGVKNIGPKKALKYIKEYGSIENLMREKSIVIDNLDEIRKIFLRPDVTENYRVEWKDYNENGLMEFMVHEHNFSEERIRGAIEKLKVFKKVRSQKNIDQWF